MIRKRAAPLAFGALIALCVLGSSMGLHRRAGGLLHDFAVRLGLYEVPSGTPHPISLVVIDDNAIEQLSDGSMGRITWPWPRSVHAHVVEELDRLGVKTIAFDVSFGEAKEPAEDEALRRAIEKHGGVILAARLAGEGAFDKDLSQSGGLFEAVEARRETGLGTDGRASMVSAMRAGESLSASEERAIDLLAGDAREDPAARARAARRLDQAHASLHARSSSLVAKPYGPSRFPALDEEALFPTPSVGLGSAGVGNTDMGSRSGETDGVVRRVPLWVRSSHVAFPMLGFAAALHHSEALVDHARDHSTTTAGRFERVPTGVASMPGFVDPVGGVMRVRWPTSGDWQTQFDTGDQRRLFSITEVLDLAPLRLAIERDVRTLEDEFGFALSVIGGPVDEQAFLNASRAVRSLDGAGFVSASDQRAHAGFVQDILDHAADLVSSIESTPEAERAPGDADTLAFARQMLEQRPVVDRLDAAVTTYRERMIVLAPMRGGLVFIGSVATKRANDLAPTSIDPETPGVFVHAAIAHSVLTGRALAPAPVWLPPVLTLLFCLLGLGIGARTNQWVGLGVCVVIVVVWFFFATAVLDVRLGLGRVVAAPILALFVVWLARSTYRALTELRARKRTEQRFKAYVAPEVVDILVSNPELSSMEPQRRELTVMFSDIAGFTTMAERLGTQRTTDVLSEYLRSMTDVLQETGATLDKYLGDGIMAFWGAPIVNEGHAYDAARAALMMLDRLDDLNQRGVFEEVGPAAIRIGLATGVVSVGDYGNPPSRSAYTVIGDSVNLSARLESANKQLGTTIIMNDRCSELVGDRLRTREVGSLVVVGKSTPVPVREVLGTRSPKGDHTDAWVRLSGEATASFLGRRWDEAREKFARLRDEFDDGKIAALHLEAIDRLEGEGDLPPSIELTEK